MRAPGSVSSRASTRRGVTGLALFCAQSVSRRCFSARSRISFLSSAKATNVPSIIGASVIVWGYTLLVSRGIKDATAVNAVVTLSKMVPLFVVIVSIIFLQRFDPEILHAELLGRRGRSAVRPIKSWAQSRPLRGSSWHRGRVRYVRFARKSLLTSARQRSFPSAAFWRSNLVVSILGMGILPRRAAGGTVQPQSGGHHGSRRRPLGRRAYQLRCHPFASGSHAGLYRLDFRGPDRSGASRCVHEELRGHEQEGRALCARSSFPRSSSKRSSC